MSALSEVVYMIGCDYPACSRELGPDPELDRLRGDAASEDQWWSDGIHDYCEEHRNAWDDQ